MEEIKNEILENGDINTGKDETLLESDPGKKEKMFTKEEVNEIVRKRLSRIKDQQRNFDELDEREKSITQRENTLNCRMYLFENGLSEAYLDLFDNSDFETFKKKIEVVEKIKSGRKPKRNPMGRSPETNDFNEDIGGFGKVKHNPRKQW